MAKKSAVFLAGLVLCGASAIAAANPWSHLKKIYFYNYSGDVAAVRENLAQMDIQGLAPADRSELLQKLNELGDRYFQKKDYPLAEAFYRKILLLSPRDAWPVCNKLEKIRRLKGKTLWDLQNIGRQTKLVIGNFNGAFLLLNGFFNVLFFSGLLLFYLVVAVMFITHFKLVTHDFILGGNSDFQVKRLVLLLALLFWPLFFLGGWGFYPFLFCGFMWIYLDHEGRQNIKRIVVIILAVTVAYSFNNYLEKSLQSPAFQIIENVYAGKLYPESVTSRFDNELKVMQAHAYYTRQQTDTALDILQATGNNYNSTLKLDLLGDIYFKKGNIAQSIQFYRQSLSIDDRDPVTLKNFTLALLKSGDPESLKFYQASYPEIQNYRDKVSVLEAIRLPETILWKRLLNFSRPGFHVLNFLAGVAVEFFKLPIILACLLMFVYISLLKKLSPQLGQSTFCNKCRKIIKKKSVEQAHSLCEDCYQLFLIKDPIFFEAKIIKEKEINRKAWFKYSLSLIVSLLIPGFCLNFRNKTGAFILTFMLFFNCLGFYLFTALTFGDLFGVVPLFVNFIGMLAVVLYLAINAFSLSGDDHGF